MSGIKCEKNLVHGLNSHSMNNSALKNMLKEYNKLFTSCYGPKGSFLLHQNVVERDTVISSSSMITSQISFSHPALKFINALIDAQNKHFGLYGSYIGILCSGILIKVFDLESDGVARCIISDVLELIVEKLLDCLIDPTESIAFNIDFVDVNSLMEFIKTILFSKPQFTLTEDEKNHLAISVASAFVKSIPNSENIHYFGKIHVKNCKEINFSEIQVFDGILYSNPSFYNEELAVNILSKSHHNLILFNVPLMFDSKETVSWKGEGYRNNVFNQEILNQLKTHLQSRNITLLMNQKVIDPLIKYELEKHGIIAMERLGTAMTAAIVKITGCDIVSKLSCTGLQGEIEAAVTGSLSQVKIMRIGNSDYILLSDNKSTEITILIPEKDVHFENYLTAAIDSCSTSLRLLVQNPKVFVGGGCLESHFAMMINKMVLESEKEISSELGVSNSEIIKVCNSIKAVFLDMAANLILGPTKSFDNIVIDKGHGHLWNYCGLEMNNLGSTCACSIFSYSNNSTEPCLSRFCYTDQILNVNSLDLTPALSQSLNNGFVRTSRVSKCDLFSAKLNALRLAFDGLSQLLKIGYCIFDK